MRLKQPKSQRAGTATGLRMAYNLADRQELSIDQVKQIYRFLTRNKRFTNFPEPSRARQAWYLWGGRPAYNWAKKILKEEGII